MVFLQNVTLSLAYREARAHHGASGHYFRDGIKCWQSFCPCLLRATTVPPLTRVAAHRQCHRHWDRAGSGLQRELQAPPGHQWGSKPRAQIITPPANSPLPNFMKLKNTRKHLCAVTSKMVQPQETRIEAGWLWHPPNTTYVQGFNFNHANHDIRKQIFKQQPKANTLTQTSLTLILRKLLSALPKLSCTWSLTSPWISLLPVHSLPLGKLELLGPC